MKQAYISPEVYRNVDFFELHVIQMDQLMLLIGQIKVFKSSGIDNISSCAIKDALTVLNNQLLHLINMSIRTNDFPDDWKKGTVIPPGS